MKFEKFEDMDMLYVCRHTMKTDKICLTSVRRDRETTSGKTLGLQKRLRNISIKSHIGHIKAKKAVFFFQGWVTKKFKGPSKEKNII